MVTTVHRLPIDDSFNFQALAGQLSARTCDDCGAPADVGLEYYSNGKYTPGEDLCWDCSDRYGPFTSDRAAEKAGREPYVNPGSAARTAGDLDNPDLAEAVRELGEDPSGDVWLAARLLRRHDLPVDRESLDGALTCVRHVAAEGHTSRDDFAALEAAIDEAWIEESPTSSVLRDSVSMAAERGFWIHVWRHDQWEDHNLREDAAVEAVVDRTARAGDLAALYVTSPVSGIVALMVLTSDPAAADADLAGSAGYFRFVASQRVVAVFDRPFTIREMRQVPELAGLAGLRQNFQLSAISVAPERWNALIGHLESRHEGLRDRLAELEAPTPRRTFGSERELEDHLVDNIESIGRLFGVDLRLADETRDGIPGRQPMLDGTDTRPDLVCVNDSHGTVVVVELKNTPAKAEHIGQLASYVGCIRQHYPHLGSAYGLLITQRETRQCRAALAVVPGVGHVTIGEVLGEATPLGITQRGWWDDLVEEAEVVADAAMSLVAAVEVTTPGQEDSSERLQARQEYLVETIVRLLGVIGGDEDD